MTRTITIPEDAMHSPMRVAREVVTWAQDVAAADAPILPIPGAQDMLLPLYPGRFMTLLSRPGHGKTSMLGFCSRELARGLDPKTEALVFISLEQYVEEVATMLASHKGVTLTDVYRQNFDGRRLMETAEYLSRSPIWIMGHSIKEHGRNVLRSPSGRNFSVPYITKDVILNCLWTMEKQYKVKPKAVLLDYLQILHVDGPGAVEDKIQQIPPILKELAMRLEVPVIAAAQASRDVDRRDYKLPMMYDAQWASTIEQASDVMMSLWRLALTEKIGDEVAIRGTKVPITEDMLLAGLIKQRGGPAPGKWLLRFDPATLGYGEYILEDPVF